MAVTATKVSEYALAGSDSRSLTLTAGTSLLIVALCCRYGTDGGAVTWDGGAMTELVAYDPNPTPCTRVLYTTSPATGAKTLAIPSVTNWITVAVIEVANANTSSPFRDQGGGVYYVGGAENPTDGTISVTIASASGDLVLDFATGYALGVDYTPSAGAGQTGLFDTNVNDANGSEGWGSTKAGAASVTMSWTGILNNGTVATTQVAISVRQGSTFSDTVTGGPIASGSVQESYVPSGGSSIIGRRSLLGVGT